MPGALEALRQLAEYAELLVLTARRESRIPSAEEWLERHGVRSLFTGIHTSAGSSKAQACQDLGANVLIDDDSRHVVDLEVEGLRPILLQDGRPDGRPCGPGVTFCRSWAEVVCFVESLRE